MATREIIKVGDPILRKKSRRVDAITPRILTLLDDMTETLAEVQGAGLAAVQLGVLRRVIIIDTFENGELGSYVGMINPEILSEEGEQSCAEGCLSLPGEFGVVTRPEKVRIRYTNRNWNSRELECEGMAARAACHEIDHLNGIMYTERAERMLTPEEIDEMHEEDDR
ncbi:MAG: peptide deformylase [Oscillospiraceae bacterium]|nr:peptide deformylase [Oscillospiraceae bacterium]